MIYNNDGPIYGSLNGKPAGGTVTMLLSRAQSLAGSTGTITTIYKTDTGCGCGVGSPMYYRVTFS
jgi:hypothetical protein